MKKLISALAVVCLMLMLVAGCGGGGGNEPASDVFEGFESSEETSQQLDPTKVDPSTMTVAVCMGEINHPVHRIVQMGFLTKAEELGYTGEVSGLDSGSLQELMAKWESSVTNGASGILLWTGDDSAYELMRTLHAGGCRIVVPHFVHSYSDTKEFLDRNISCLAAEYGRNSADFIVEKLEEKGITEGTIGITQNTTNVTENAANDSFRAEINRLGVAYTCSRTVFEGAEVTEAATKVTGVIQLNPDIVAGFGTTGGSPQSWATAMENTGRTDLVVVGMDYTELNINLVKDGSIAAIVCQPLYGESQESMATLDALFRGEDFSGSEADWFLELPAPLAYVGGEGDSDIAAYDEIIAKVVEYFTD